MATVARDVRVGDVLTEDDPGKVSVTLNLAVKEVRAADIPAFRRC
ncbi:hypothetical protein ACWGJX_30840 [Streptomyces sp. NPDC054775]